MTATEKPFADGEFDLAVAAWMLYHVADLERALVEIARVLRPGGRLVAVTSGLEHLQEIWDLAGRENGIRAFPFRTENGDEVLSRHFARVERRDAIGWVTMDDDTLRAYVESWEELAPALERLPLGRPLRIRRASSIFVADKGDAA